MANQKTRSTPKKAKSTVRAAAREVPSLAALKSTSSRALGGITSSLTLSPAAKSTVRRYSPIGISVLAVGGLAAIGYSLLERSPATKQKVADAFRVIQSRVMSFTSQAKAAAQATEAPLH